MLVERGPSGRARTDGQGVGRAAPAWPPDLPTVPAPAARWCGRALISGPYHTSGALTSSPIPRAPRPRRAPKSRLFPLSEGRGPPAPRRDAGTQGRVSAAQAAKGPRPPMPRSSLFFLRSARTSVRGESYKNGQENAKKERKRAKKYGKRALGRLPRPPGRSRRADPRPGGRAPRRPAARLAPAGPGGHPNNRGCC